MFEPAGLSPLSPVPKRYFNPNNVEDLEEFKFFVENNKWRTVCPFEIEWPRISLPDMISERIVKTHLNTLINTLKNLEKQ